METKTFEVGKQYRDTKELQEDTCILEFVKYDKDGDTYFKEFSNINCYIKDENGLIGFFGEPTGFMEHK